MNMYLPIDIALSETQFRDGLAMIHRQLPRSDVEPRATEKFLTESCSRNPVVIALDAEGPIMEWRGHLALWYNAVFNLTTLVSDSALQTLTQYAVHYFLPTLSGVDLNGLFNRKISTQQMWSSLPQLMLHAAFRHNGESELMSALDQYQPGWRETIKQLWHMEKDAETPLVFHLLKAQHLSVNGQLSLAYRAISSEMEITESISLPMARRCVRWSLYDLPDDRALPHKLVQNVIASGFTLEDEYFTCEIDSSLHANSAIGTIIRRWQLAYAVRQLKSHEKKNMSLPLPSL